MYAKVCVSASMCFVCFFFVFFFLFVLYYSDLYVVILSYCIFILVLIRCLFSF